MVHHIKKLLNFISHDLWRMRIRKLPRHKYFLFRILRIFTLAVRGFDEDKCQLRASALTFYTLLSIVPVVAMGFGIAKGFGFEQGLESLITQKLEGQEEVARRIVEFSKSFLANTKGGLIAGVGIAVLFWTVIKVLGNIEMSFNDIWGIKNSRTWARKFSDYLSIVLICPILLIMSSSMTVFITSQVMTITEKIKFLETFDQFIVTGLKLLPYAVVWTVFTFVYMYMPNTKVSFKAGLLSGIIAGSIYQMVQGIYIYFQIGVAQHNAIYGSFAALPLFLIWLQTSWLVVLFGAEISFAVDNEETYEFEGDCRDSGQRFKRLLALKITEMCVKNFAHAGKPLKAQEIAKSLEAPIRLVREVLFELTQTGILSEIKPRNGAAELYQPGIDTEQLTIKTVMDLLDRKNFDYCPIVKEDELESVRKPLELLDQTIEKSSHNMRVKDL